MHVVRNSSCPPDWAATATGERSREIERARRIEWPNPYEKSMHGKLLAETQLVRTQEETKGQQGQVREKV